MGSVIPVGRSLIPCYYNLEDRGFYYGMFELSAGIGGVLGAVIGVLSTSAPAGTLYLNNTFAGWQLAYLILAALITPLAVMFHFCVIDPNHDSVAKELPEEQFNRLFPGVTTSLLKKEDFYILFKSKMFVALLLQGATGAFPWAGLR
jgi:MFS family permease